MASNLPYTCARCLRSSKSASLSYCLSKSNSTRIANVRRYFSASPQFISRPQLLVARHSYSALATTAHPQRYQFYSTATTSSTTPSHEPPLNLSRSSQSGSTIPVWNPQFSESGDPLVVAITPRAAHRLQTIMKTDSNPALCLRITVESGGCHGFQYLMSLTDSSQISREEDTLFVYTKEGTADTVGTESNSTLGEVNVDTIYSGQPKMVMDSASLELLEGSKIDYTMELIGSQFKIVDNPRATSSCGCGTSFDVKI